MFQRVMSILAALAIGMGTLSTAAALEKREEIRFTCVGAERLWEEAVGETMEEMAEAAREKGLENPVTEEKLAASGARIDREEGMIYMIRSSKELRKVRNAREATEMAWSLVRLLGGDEKTGMELYARLHIGDTRIYCFCQTRDEIPLYGRMLKIVADRENSVHTVISSLGFPEETDESLGLEEDLLGQMIVEAETPDVPDFSKMIRDEWTCETETDAGERMKITVPVTQDPETNLWYLADPERKIVLGDFKKMVMDRQKDCLLSSMEKDGWDPSDVMVYYRIIQCWDYYAQKGWTGPDGQETPILALNNLCMINGESMENTCYIGLLQGPWQTFAYSQEAGFGLCLDVLAHEYTHCITETSATGGMYKDDYGAINEAISDILGNICEMQMGETKDKEWNLGENLGMAFRSMSNPHDYGQPAYVWDQFYTPKALYPNDINDRGGVHTNSSILNYVASRLCLDAGMTLEEAGDFWMTVNLGLSSRTDYYQMTDLMEWALEITGLEKYRESLQTLTEKTQMTRTQLPETVPEGLMRVELTLPDTEALQDPDWILMGFQVQTGKALELLLDLLAGSPEEGEPETGFASHPEQPAAEENVETAWRSAERIEPETWLDRIFTSYTTWVTKEGEPMTMMMERGLPSFYLLLNLDPNTGEPRRIVLMRGGKWVDLDPADSYETEQSEEQVMQTLKEVFKTGLDLLFPENTERKVLPDAGLESVMLPVTEKEIDPSV